MDPARVADLLAPFLEPDSLSPHQLASISIYIDILVRWNAHLNLTAIRRPEDIVTRHFGESLFAARHLFPRSLEPEIAHPPQGTLADLGSGPGFPGIPIGLWMSNLHVTLIESNQKKATFLREVIRAIKFTNIDVLCAHASPGLSPAAGRGRSTATEGGGPRGSAATEGLSSPSSGAAHRYDTVTLRAVERFAEILPVAASLIHPSGRLALLIGEEQSSVAHDILPQFSWLPRLPLPNSRHRVLSIAQAPPPDTDSPVA